MEFIGVLVPMNRGDCPLIALVCTHDTHFPCILPLFLGTQDNIVQVQERIQLKVAAFERHDGWSSSSSAGPHRSGEGGGGGSAAVGGRPPSPSPPPATWVNGAGHADGNADGIADLEDYEELMEMDGDI